MTKTQIATDTIPLFKVFMAPDAPEKVAEVLRSGYIGQGPQVTEFEKEFGEFVGCRPPLSVNSCTSAITLALWLCGVRSGDYCIATPMTCSASVTPIANLQAKVLWADIDPRTGLIDVDSVKSLCMAHKGRVRAIIAVDWGGHKCDYDALKSFGIPVIQDAAHSINALPGGDYTAWSTQAIKFLTTSDGGFLLTPEDQHARAKLLRWYGFDRESSADFRCAQSINEAGFKFQMNDVMASIGRANLRYLDGILLKQRNNARVLTSGIWNPKVECPADNGDFWLFTVRIKGNREEFMMHMKDAGIAVSQVHRRCDEHPCFAYAKRHLPGVDAFSSSQCSLPVGWWLGPDDIQRVADGVNSWK